MDHRRSLYLNHGEKYQFRFSYEETEAQKERYRGIQSQIALGRRPHFCVRLPPSWYLPLLTSFTSQDRKDRKDRTLDERSKVLALPAYLLLSTSQICSTLEPAQGPALTRAQEVFTDTCSVHMSGHLPCHKQP